MLRYFSTLSAGRLVLWCYLAWYLAIVALYFHGGSPALWCSSLGMSGIIGFALVLSTSSRGQRPKGWTLFRLFMMPFCVSSYAALINGRGFVLIFPPSLSENLIGAAACLSIVAVYLSCRFLDRETAAQTAGA